VQTHLTLGRRAVLVLVGLSLLTAFQPGTAMAPKSAKAKPAQPVPATAVPLVAHLTGYHETPPNASTATGLGMVTLSADQTMIKVDLSFSGLVAPATAAHIHGPAGPGVPAGVLFPLAGVPASTSGSIPEQTFAVTPAQVVQLLAGQWYINVHDATFPGGEIRGQILADHFTAKLAGSQETPPNASTAMGTGSVSLSADQTSITVDLSFSGLSTPAILAHIHGPAVVGAPAGVVFPFSGVPNATSGRIPEQSFAITPAQVVQLRAGQLYFNVHSTTFPKGEIRGQIFVAPDFQGIRMVTAFSQVVAFGHAAIAGPTLTNLSAPIVGMTDTPDFQGYWLTGSDGGVFAFGGAGFFGSLGSIHLNAPIVGMAHSFTGAGYWLVAADGGVFAFGDAPFMGSLGSIHLNAAIVGITPTPDGKGYLLVGADGGVFAFGDAVFHGSLGAIHLNAPIVGISSTPDTMGYRLVASDGGVFCFGTAGFFGSAGGAHLSAPVVGIARTADNQGYWLAGADGGVFNYGDAGFLGSVPGLVPQVKLPVVGIVATGSGAS
jgi:hypothetical protein